MELKDYIDVHGFGFSSLSNGRFYLQGHVEVDNRNRFKIAVKLVVVEPIPIFIFAYKLEKD